MGLFRRKSHDRGAWANPPPPGLVRSVMSEDTNPHHQSLASREGSALDEEEAATSSCTTAHDNGSGPNSSDASERSHHVHTLEQQLADKDDELSRLRAAMAAQETAHARRIGLLERQLELLVELSSTECARRGDATIVLYRAMARSSDELELYEIDEAGARRSDVGKSGEVGTRQKTQEKKGEAKSDEDEAAALKELLARIIAERDRLAFRNEELERWARERAGAAGEERASTRSDVDAVLDGGDDCSSDEGEAAADASGSDSEAARTEGEKGALSTGHAAQRRRGESPVSVDRFNATAEDEERQEEDAGRDAPSTGVHATPEDVRSVRCETGDFRPGQRVLYKLSCRDCPAGGAITYLGSYTSRSADARHKLSKALKGHFARVWDAVRREGREAATDGAASTETKVDDVREFASSALAVHLAEHCRGCASEREAVRWCVAHVKVKIEKHEAHDSERAKEATAGEGKVDLDSEEDEEETGAEVLDTVLGNEEEEGASSESSEEIGLVLCEV